MKSYYSSLGVCVCIYARSPQRPDQPASSRQQTRDDRTRKSKRGRLARLSGWRLVGFCRDHCLVLVLGKTACGRGSEHSEG